MQQELRLNSKRVSKTIKILVKLVKVGIEENITSEA